MVDLYFENFSNLLSINVLSDNNVDFRIKIQSPTFNCYNNNNKYKNQSLYIENINIDDIEKMSCLMDIEEGETSKEINIGVNCRYILKYKYSEELNMWVLSISDKSHKHDTPVMFVHEDVTYIVQCIKAAYAYISTINNI